RPRGRGAWRRPRRRGRARVRHVRPREPARRARRRDRRGGGGDAARRRSRRVARRAARRRGDRPRPGRHDRLRRRAPPSARRAGAALPRPAAPPRRAGRAPRRRRCGRARAARRRGHPHGAGPARRRARDAPAQRARGRGRGAAARGARRRPGRRARARRRPWDARRAARRPGLPVGARPGGRDRRVTAAQAATARVPRRRGGTFATRRPGAAGRHLATTDPGAPLKILVPSTIALDVQAGPDDEVVVYDAAAPFRPEDADAEVLVVWASSAENLADAAARLRRVRWVQTLAAGPDAVLAAGFGPHVTITSGRSLHGGPLAEHALAFVLACGRRLDALGAAQREHRWDLAVNRGQSDPATPALYTLDGARVTIWGFGSIA